jgi:hypothetical protein
MLKRIGKAMQAVFKVDLSASVERTEIEPVIVEHPASLRVGGEQHLEAAIKGEAIDSIRAHTSADGIG